MSNTPRPGTAWWFVLAAIVATLSPCTRAATNVVLWDTGTRLADATEASNRTAWKAVPSELFVFETEPAKAASDPGYYGREYSFQGDAVVENRRLTAVFCAAKGQMTLYAKAEDLPNEAQGTRLGSRILEIVPFFSTAQPAQIRSYEILRNAGDEVVLAVSYSTKGAEGESLILSFGRNEIVEIKPSEKLKVLRLISPIEYAVLPGFVGDDVILGPAEFGTNHHLSLPSENVFLGLLNGGRSQWMMTWPKGPHGLNLSPGQEGPGRRVVESLEFQPVGQSVYLAAMDAPGLWHREELKPTYLEKDVPLTWKRPFPAKWKTQLSEAGVRTTFNFRESKGQIWRGVPGSYNYPVWFNGENAVLHLSKKVPPKGEALIYFMEGQDTPAWMMTPVEMVKATLGRSLSDSILDSTGRKLRTHHRRGGEGVHRACTCGCTEAIQAVFEAGQEVTKQEFVKEALSDMNYFVDRHVERIDEYRQFAAGLIDYLQKQGAAAPQMKPYLEELTEIVQQIPQECSVQKENMKSPEHAADLTRRTMALTVSKSTNNVPAYMELLKAWRAMGGAQDYVVAQCHTITRKLFQEAAYRCLTNSDAVPVAQEVRKRCRQVLRNPDGYEIWGDY